MPTLHVCPLSRLHDTVAATRASHVVSLMGVGAEVERPATIAAERHLFIGVSDIVEPMEGYVLPAATTPGSGPTGAAASPPPSSTTTSASARSRST